MRVCVCARACARAHACAPMIGYSMNCFLSTSSDSGRNFSYWR